MLSQRTRIVLAGIIVAAAVAQTVPLCAAVADSASPSTSTATQDLVQADPGRSLPPSTSDAELDASVIWAGSVTTIASDHLAVSIDSFPAQARAIDATTRPSAAARPADNSHGPDHRRPTTTAGR